MVFGCETYYKKGSFHKTYFFQIQVIKIKLLIINYFSKKKINYYLFTLLLKQAIF